MRSFVLLLLLLFAFFACKKDSPAISLKKEIAGKWELKTRYGGWIGTQNFSPGNGNSIEFFGNNYKRVMIYNDTTVYRDSGSCEVFSGTACNGIGQTIYIKFIAVPATNDVEDINIANGELIIGQNSCIADGVTSIYTRLQ